MKPRLLIAESDVSVADDCRHFFWKRGLDVETAIDGLQCFEMLQICPPHAMILDYELLWGGGDGVLTRMREAYHLASIPVLVITTSASMHSNGSARRALGGAPVVACFCKPFRMELLWRALSVEMPELATEQFLAEAQFLLPLVRVY